MAVIYEKVVQEDLNLGAGTVKVTQPAGGSATGTKINIGSFLPGVVSLSDHASGSTSDDATEGVEEAIARVPSTGGMIFAPSGTYNLTRKITGKNGLVIQGAGQYNTIFRQYANQDCFYFPDGDSRYASLRDIQIYDGLGIASRTAGHGINADGTSNFARVDLENVYILGHLNGANYTIVGYTTLRGCRVVGAKQDSYAFAGSNGVNLTLDNCASVTAGRYGYSLSSVSYVLINGGIADSSTNHGYYFSGGASVTINSTSAEGGSQDGYHFLTTQSVTMNSPSASKITTQHGIYLDGVRYFTINTPRMATITGYGFYFANTNLDVTVTNPYVSGAVAGLTNRKGDIGFSTGAGGVVQQ